MSKTFINKQAGFSLVSAIFIIVILAALGSYMVSISGIQSNVPVAAVQGARAMNAARTAIEFASYQLLNAAPPVSCATINTTNLSLTQPGLKGFNIDLDCSQTNHVEGSFGNFDLVVVTATATFSAYGDPDYVERVVRTTLVVK